MIDDFSTGSFAQSITAGSWIGSQLGSMYGGERDSGMLVQANPLNQFMDMSVQSGLVITSSGALLDGQSGVEYDGVGDETDNVAPFERGPGLNANFSASADRFRLNFLANDLPMSVLAYVYTYGSPDALSTSTVAVGANQNSFSVDIPFSSFAGGASFSDVDRFGFIFETGPSGDFALESIEAVPEPATMAAIGAGIVGLIARRRRK